MGFRSRKMFVLITMIFYRFYMDPDSADRDLIRILIQLGLGPDQVRIKEEGHDPDKII